MLDVFKFEVKMLPREKLIQCFSCKNNLDCWGLKEEIPLGINEHENALTPEAMRLFIQEVGKENLNMGEQFGIFCMIFLQELRADNVIVKSDVYSLIHLLAAFANSSNDGWICPGEDPEYSEKWIYEPREGIF